MEKHLATDEHGSRGAAPSSNGPGVFLRFNIISNPKSLFFPRLFFPATRNSQPATIFSVFLRVFPGP